MKTVFLTIFFFIMIIAISDVHADEHGMRVPVCFEKNTANAVMARSVHIRQSFQVIPKGQNDNQKEWFSEHIVMVGDTITIKGGQSQQYVEITEINREYVEVLNWGWAKGIGEFRLSEKIKYGCASDKAHKAQ